jgi:hypothetical protein
VDQGFLIPQYCENPSKSLSPLPKRNCKTRAPPATNLSQVVNFLGPESTKSQGSEAQKGYISRVSQLLTEFFDSDYVNSSSEQILRNQHRLVFL